MATTTFWTLAPRHRPEAVAVFHLMRNIGSGLFISWSVAAVIRTAGANYNRLMEFVTLTSESLTMPWVVGSRALDSLPGLLSLADEIPRQARMIGYLNAFGMFTITCAVAMPLILLVRKQRV